ncbi:hypothetical protein [Chromobacterium sphagni]|uniref:hypothetical protein n=1 Tax=Chromobacterium sphagni TaxID=1903179 RepID=UPI001113A17C|nr:hypothetical protein [Chromobacterium sphagni]
MPRHAAVSHADHGRSWTHSLAINDLCYDNINFLLQQSGRADIVNIPASDGSNSAMNRIREGISQQKATVAEPCNQQGWQLAKELSRGFVSRHCCPTLTTATSKTTRPTASPTWTPGSKSPGSPVCPAARCPTLKRCHGWKT